jgi:hypothetical protein
MFARLDGLFARPRGDAPLRRGQAAGMGGPRPARPGGFPGFDNLPNAGMGRYQPRWARPSYLSEMGGGDVREGLRRVQRLPYEKILATLVNHPDLIHRHGEAVTLLTFPNADPDGTIGEDGAAADSAPDNDGSGNLDKLRAAIIDLAARYPQLDAVALQNHLRDQGFSAGLDSLLARTADYRFTLRSADPVFAEEGLLHVMAVLREPDIRAELAEAAAALSTSMTEENLARFEAAQRLALEAESRRRDIDRDAFGQVVKQ